MLDNVERFNMSKAPSKPRLLPLMWTLCIPASWAHKEKITKVNMKGIKPPYLLIQNHNAFLDFKTLTRAVFPHRCNYIVAIDGFIGREGLLRSVGGICKRKFTNDINLIKNLKKVIADKHILVIYPEARYSLCGTDSYFPLSMAKLAKFLNVPVVSLCCHGHHVNSPFWNLHNNNLKGLEAKLECIATKEEVKSLTNEELYQRMRNSLTYDDFKWQLDNKVRNKYKGRAEGLEKVLYQCPHCHTEYEMTTSGNIIKCNHCGKSYEMSEYGELHATEGETEFSHIPSWYEWQRANVRKEIDEGKYHFEAKVRVDALPNAKGYIDLGEGYLVHDKEGFHLSGEYQGEKYNIEYGSDDHDAVHIEYNYLGKHGDCIDINTLTDTFYVYPKIDKFSVTKLSLAAEEFHRILHPEEK